MKKVLIVSFLCMLLTGCQSSSTDKIRIGCKDFTENEIVAEVYALALEEHGYDVERVFDISGSLIHTAIINDEIDVYPEYTGTGLLVHLKEEMITDPKEVFETVKKGYEETFGLTWLSYAQANDGQGVVVSRKVADALGIKTISDLQAHASTLRFASQGEIDQREDGIKMLEKVYGEFTWKSSRVVDNGLKYEVLRQDEADVSVGYTTEGYLTDTEHFVLLEDNKQAWPPYNLAPVIQQDVLETHTDIEEILHEVNQHLDTKTLTSLNAQVDLEKKEYREVAKVFYQTIK